VSEPESLAIIPAGRDHRFRFDRPGRALFWMIDPAQLQSIADGEWGEPTVEILEACSSRSTSTKSIRP
jgi:hypothetical protein